MSANIFSILRFSAAMIVILYKQQSHFKDLSNLPAFLLAGAQMVTFFFVLSGFVLVIAYRHHDTILIKQFLKKRLLKIYPLYLVSLLLPVVLLMANGQLDYWRLFLHLSFTQTWIPLYPFINGPSWFLSGLMFCYIAFPIIFNKIKSSSFKPNFLLFLALILWLVTQIILTILLNTDFYQGYRSISHKLIYHFPLSHFCSFLLGFSGALFLTKDTRSESLHSKTFYIVIVLSLLLLIATMQFEDYITELTNLKFAFNSSFYAPFFLLLIGSVYLIGNRKNEKAKIGIFATLGSISFPIYLLQDTTDLIVYYFTYKYCLNEALSFVIYLFVLIIFGLIYVNFVEKYLQNFIKNKLLS